MQNKLRMAAYYFGFSKTGVRKIDVILSAIATAGEMFHSTDQWTDEVSFDLENMRGNAPVDWIQYAADDAAKAFSTAQAERDAANARVVGLSESVESYRRGVKAAATVMQTQLDNIADLKQERDKLQYERDAARTELDILRGIASKLMPCHYCGAEDIAKCPQGFPGCALADDISISDETLNAKYREARTALAAANAECERLLGECNTFKEAHKLRGDEIERLRTENAELREQNEFILSRFPSDGDLGMIITTTGNKKP